jgi:hypothetical protein
LQVVRSLFRREQKRGSGVGCGGIFVHMLSRVVKRRSHTATCRIWAFAYAQAAKSGFGETKPLPQKSETRLSGSEILTIGSEVRKNYVKGLFLLFFQLVL